MKNSPRLMFFFGIIAFTIIMIVVNKKNLSMQSTEFWFYRILISLTSASISISIPGMLHRNYTSRGDGIQLLRDRNDNPTPMTLAEKEPILNTSGAIAVFIIVYLFNPII